LFPQEKKHILHEYCAGNLTWRQAADLLGLDDFAAFETALTNAGLHLYEPDEKASEEKMAALDAILDEGL
jgi:hypothetical protein